MAEFDPKTPAERLDLANEPDFKLGGLTVRPADLALERNGERHKLQPRVMKVLLALVKAQSGVVSRDRLVELCWDGRVVGDDALNRCVLALRHLAQQFTPEPFVIQTVPRVGHRLVAIPGEEGHLAKERAGGRAPAATSRLVIAGVLVALLAVAIFLDRTSIWPVQASTGEPTVLVTAAANDVSSQARARDLAVKLGTFQAVPAASMRLIGEERSPAKPDLTLEVGRTADSPLIGATLVLKAAADRTILWSKEFKQASGNAADLNQQMAFSVARVLDCAAEGMDSREHLNEPTLKTYLNACAALSDSRYDVRSIMPMVEDVVRASPKFVGGWAKLLSAEAAAVSDDSEGVALRPVLARHIDSARKLEPDLAEAYIAEYILTPSADFLARSRLIDRAVARNPNHAFARIERAMFSQSVGLTNDALRDTQQAVRLDPLSPAVRDGYITMLAIAGRTDAAREELSKAERLWPGATSLVQARYRLHLRFGDPQEALWLLRSGAVNLPGAKMQEVFLLARINPSSKNIDRAIQKGRNALRAGRGIDNQAQTLAEFDRKEELLSLLLNWRKMEVVDAITGVLFRPAFADLHRDPRFIRVADHLGLLEYWRASGRWPDFCIAPDLPYDCKAEAAKMAG